MAQRSPYPTFQKRIGSRMIRSAILPEKVTFDASDGTKNLCMDLSISDAHELRAFLNKHLPAPPTIADQVGALPVGAVFDVPESGPGEFVKLNDGFIWGTYARCVITVPAPWKTGTHEIEVVKK